jgi:hypothetical protein
LSVNSSTLGLKRIGVNAMTLDEIKASDKTVLTPSEIAEVLKADAQDIRLAARRNPERLGFNVSVIGTRVKVPRLAFIRWVEGQ